MCERTNHLGQVFPTLLPVEKEERRGKEVQGEKERKFRKEKEIKERDKGEKEMCLLPGSQAASMLG